VVPVIGARLLRWLLEVERPEPARLFTADELGRVVLELEPVYPNGATGALTRLTVLELFYRATTDDDAEKALWPAVFEVPAHGAHGVRVRLVESDGHPAIYAGETTTADPDRMPDANTAALWRVIP
jgi:hypothetical protein